MANAPIDHETLLELEEQFKGKLITKVNSQLESTIPDNPTSDETREKIQEYNAEEDAKRSVIDKFNENETARIKRQPRLLTCVVALTVFQLIAFNIIIAGAGWLAFKHADATVIQLFFEILKYYIGATVLELVGMVWFVTKGTFTTEHLKSLDSMIGKKS